MHDEGAVPSIELDVRPALDSAGAAVDRARMLGRSLLGAAIFGGTTATAAAAEPGAATARDAASDRAAAFWNAAAASGGIGFAEERAGAAEPTVTAAAAAARAAVDAVREKCAAKMAALAACEGQPAEEARASIDLTLCLADQVCQPGRRLPSAQGIDRRRRRRRAVRGRPVVPRQVGRGERVVCSVERV